MNVGQAFVEIRPDTKNFEREAEKGMAPGLKRLGVAAGATILAAGAGVAAFGAKSAATFAKVGGEVNKLIRYTGGSAEEMSRLRFAASQAGLDVDSLGGSMGILSRNLAAGGAAGQNFSAVLKANGISARDAQGRLLPVNDTLLNIAERFKSMPNGVQKTALAMKLFGRSGAQMIPFLNRGRDGLAELQAEASKFGLVLTKDNLVAIKANVKAHREFGAAMQGLQVQVGQYVLPVFTRLAEFATSKLVPAIVVVADLARRYLGPAFQFAFDAIGRVLSGLAGMVDRYFLPAFSAVASYLQRTFGPVFDTVFGGIGRAVEIARAFIVDTALPAIQRAFSGLVDFLRPYGDKAAEALDKIREVGETKVLPWLRDTLVPFITGTLIPKLGDLAEVAKNNVAPALGGIITAAAVTQFGAFSGAIGDTLGALQALASGPGAAFIAIAALAGGLIYAYQHSETFREKVDELVKTFRQNFVPTLEKISTFIKTSVVPALKSIADFFRNYIIPALKDFVTGVGGRLVDVFHNIFDTLSENKEGLANLGRAIVTLAAAVSVVLIPVLKVLWEILITLAGTAIEAVIRALGFLGTALETAGGFIRSTRDQISGMWQGAKTVHDKLKEWLGKAVEWLKELPGKVAAAAGNWLDSLLNPAERLYNKVRDILGLLDDLDHRAVGGALERAGRIAAGGGPGHVTKDARNRATGGPVIRGNPYIVGERRHSELFVPDQNGTILPNLAGLGNTFNFFGANVTASDVMREAEWTRKTAAR